MGVNCQSWVGILLTKFAKIGTSANSFFFVTYYAKRTLWANFLFRNFYAHPFPSPCITKTIWRQTNHWPSIFKHNLQYNELNFRSLHSVSRLNAEGHLIKPGQHQIIKYCFNFCPRTVPQQILLSEASFNLGPQRK